jgi:hypothetical protein
MAFFQSLTEILEAKWSAPESKISAEDVKAYLETNQLTYASWLGARIRALQRAKVREQGRRRQARYRLTDKYKATEARYERTWKAACRSARYRGSLKYELARARRAIADRRAQLDLMRAEYPNIAAFVDRHFGDAA